MADLYYNVIPGNLRVGGLPAGSTINWGDSTPPHTFSGESDYVNHKYTSITSGLISISGPITKRTRINTDGSVTRGFIIYGTALKEIVDWGTNAISNIAFFDITESAKHSAKHSVNLTTVPNAGPPSCAYTSFMFCNCVSFNQDISMWDVSNVVNMNGMFMNAELFVQDISSWDVSNVQEMLILFSNNPSFNIDLSPWAVTNVTKMQGMLCNLDGYDKDISDWCVPNIPSEPFHFSLDTAIDDTLKEPIWGTCLDPTFEMLFRTEFAGILTIEGAPAGSTIDWGDGNVQTISGNISHTYLAQEYIAKLTFPSGMNELKIYGDPITEMISWSSQSIQHFTFYDSVSATASPNLKKIPAVQPTGITNMSYMFRESNIQDDNLELWDVSAVTNMDYMFFQASSLTQSLYNWCVTNIPVKPSNFDTGTPIFNTFKEPRWGNCTPIPVGGFNNLLFKTNYPGKLEITGLPAGSIINWGNGNTDTSTGAIAIYSSTYGTGSYFGSIDISGTVSSLKMYGYPLEEIIDWGADTINHVQFNSASGTTFSSNFKRVPPKEPTGLNSCNRMFLGTNMNDFNIQTWDVSAVTDMDSMFEDSSINQPLDTWDVSSVTTMNSTFKNAKAFNQDITSWAVQNVTTMNSMFEGALSFNQKIGVWDTTACTDISYMFYNAQAFDQNLDSWDVSNVSTMVGTFKNAGAFNGYISNWDTSSVTDMAWMFYYAGSFDGAIWKWDVSNVTNMSFMFGGAKKYNQPLKSWAVSSVKSMIGMFSNTNTFNQMLSSWDMTAVANTSYMFQNAKAFNQDISDWNTSGIVTMKYMFEGATAFDHSIAFWDVTSVTDMSHMFERAESFNKSLTAWDVAGVTDMSYMFKGARSFDNILNTWDVSTVTNMDYMFYNAEEFSSDISTWCVTNIPARPTGFSFNSKIYRTPNEPVWGTCPP